MLSIDGPTFFHQVSQKDGLFMKIMALTVPETGGCYHYFFTPPNHWQNPDLAKFIVHEYFKFAGHLSQDCNKKGRPISALPISLSANASKDKRSSEETSTTSHSKP